VIERSRSEGEGAFTRCAWIPFDLVCARAHARLGAELARRGITVRTHDLMIGATALARGLSIVTRNQRSLSRIPGLEIEDLQ